MNKQLTKEEEFVLKGIYGTNLDMNCLRYIYLDMKDDITPHFSIMIEFLIINRTITSVDLSGIHLSYYQMKQLLNVLKENKMINDLDFNGCNLTDRELLLLTQFLKTNPSLIKRLEISDNKFSKQGLLFLFNTLKDNSIKLSTLSVFNHGPTRELLPEITRYVESNDNLIELFFEFTELDNWEFNDLTREEKKLIMRIENQLRKNKIKNKILKF